MERNSNRIHLPLKNGLEFIESNTIIYAKADGNYTHIFLFGDKEILICKPIKWLMEQLTNYPFICRIHHSYLVNTNYVTKYIRGDGGQVVLQNKKSLSVSRARKPDLMKILLNN